MNARNRGGNENPFVGIDPCVDRGQQEKHLEESRVIVSIVLALMVAVITESVLLLGYVIAGASLLLVVAVLLRKAIRRFAGWRVRSSRTGWPGVNDRKAA